MALQTIDLTADLSPLEWIVPDFFPVGFLTLIGAPPGTGKTAVMAELAWQLSRPSGTFLGHPVCGPVATLYVDYDGSSGVGRNFRNGFDRIKKAYPDGDISWVTVMEPDVGSAGLQENDVVHLGQIVRDRKIKLMVLDSFMALFPGVDTNKGNQVMGPLKQVIGMARDLGVALVVLDHLPKPQQGSDPEQRGLIGSVSKTAQCRAAHLLSPAEDADGRSAVRWSCTKMTFSRPPESFAYRMNYDDGTGTLRFESVTTRPEGKSEQAYELFLDHFKKNPGKQISRQALLKLAGGQHIGAKKAQEGLKSLLSLHAGEVEEVILPERGAPKAYIYRGDAAALPETVSTPSSTAEDLWQSDVPEWVYDAECQQADYAND